MTDISLSASEVALYDRQIRLWGVGAQTRLRQSRVLIVHLTALAAECVKNLVLAGVGAITIADDNRVNPEDLAAGIFFRDADIGEYRVIAARDRIQALNPLVELQFLQTIPLADTFTSYDIVIATHGSMHDFSVYNDMCRLGTAKFYAATLAGPYGFIFVDLQRHRFQITQQVSNVATKLGRSGRGEGKVIDVRTVDGDHTMEKVTREIQYSSLSQLAAASTATADTSLYPFLNVNLRRKTRLTGLITVLLALIETSVETTANDVERVLVRAQAISDTYTLPNQPVSDLLDLYGLSLSPVAAILGGVLAQDVINVIGEQQFPIDNLVVFDSINNGIDCPVFSIGSQ
ncbi:hypothetical protein NADFUDRAFT_50789 [Nadsonia fulvescens var. elongata DSM 6958]|uniref:THIF-type NAD/FAD binding fold domain-containing protein n=1 Tax=Nadsonia fulvescens var. elongata DSM 6958 TaxID=857566 RepID=A0A1E3PKZ3_9ASCO|nr:hypothetical protein NADFUDRAFT_50789 [Nadsonia fulvescens var. elongata DSM 6958]